MPLRVPLALLLWPAVAAPAAAPAAPVLKPNLVFIMADDLGYGDLSGFGGHQSSQTPHLDGMVKGARRLSRAAACSAFWTAF